MKKKTGVFVSIIIILLLVICVFGYIQFFNQNTQIKYGSITLDLPEGFHETTSDSDDKLNITNGVTSMILSKYGDNNLTDYIEDYVNYKSQENYSVSVTNFTVNDIIIYKASIENDTNTIHYWFSYGDTVYSMYTWDGNKNFDNLVSEIVSSIRAS